MTLYQFAVLHKAKTRADIRRIRPLYHREMNRRAIAAMRAYVERFK